MNRTRNQGGFSLVELMIGIALGLIVMAALTSFFVKSSQNRREIDRAGRQIENGRYAVSALRDELHLAGFFAELSTAGVSWQTPDPCTATGAMGFQVTPLQVPVPIFGYADGATMPTCVTDRMAGTDVLVVHRLNTEMTPLASAANNSTPYLQISRCATDSTTYPWVFAAGSSAASFSTASVSGKNTACSAFNDVYRYRTEIFYVRTWSATSGDGVPTLVKIDLDWTRNTGTGLNVLPLVEGIENLRVEYGVDNDGDGAPDEYRRCDTTLTPCTAAQWANVTAARVYVLARNLETTQGYTDTKTYDMGSGATRTVGPFNDAIKRHVYAAMVTLPNRAGPRE
jgi:type IV pilus assembly protein PilW